MTNLKRVALCLNTVAGMLFFNHLAAAQSALPDGKGKALVEKTCTECHGLEGITSARNTKQRWASIVDDMASRGANATDEELDQIVNYLATNFGKSDQRKVNVNKADAAELAASLSIQSDLAAAIIKYREKNGAFKSAADLKKVPGIDAARIDDLKDRLEY